MVTIFNRKSLLLTDDMNKLYSIRRKLADNNIEHIIKTANRDSSKILNLGDSRGSRGSFAMDSSIIYMYELFVKKADYDNAVYIINNLH